MQKTTRTQSFEEYLKKSHRLRKILILGSGAVGKTSLLKVLKLGLPLSKLSPNLDYHRTPFLEFETIRVKGLMQKEIEGTFQIYDVAGQFDLPVHAMRDLTTSVLGSIDIIILVFSATNMQSLLDIAQWIERTDKYYAENNIPKSNQSPLYYVLVKNKIDLGDNIDNPLVEHLCNTEKRIQGFFSVSCTEGHGLQELKVFLVKCCFDEA